MPLDLPEDFEGAEALSKFESVEALARSYQELSKRLGSSLPAPTSDESREELFKRLGAPDSPDAYEVPAGVNPEVVKDLREFAVKARLTPDQFARLATEQQEKAAAEYAATQQAREDGGERVAQEYGDKFDEAKAHVTLALEKLGPEAASKFDVKDPEVFRALASMGAGLVPATARVAPVPGGADTQTFDAAGIAREARRILESEAYADRAHPGYSEAKEEYGRRLRQLMGAGFDGAYDKRLLPQTNSWGF